MVDPHHGLAITVVTEGHVSSEMWHITDELAAQIRTQLGEPVVRQMMPMAMLDEVIDDPRGVVL